MSGSCLCLFSSCVSVCLCACLSLVCVSGKRASEPASARPSSVCATAGLRVFASLFVCFCVRVCVYMCLCASACVSACLRACLRARVYTCVHVCDCCYQGFTQRKDFVCKDVHNKHSAGECGTCIPTTLTGAVDASGKQDLISLVYLQNKKRMVYRYG